MAVCTLGPIWSRNARLARWGRSTPFPHAYRENRPIFRSMGFLRNPSWIMCRWTLRGRWAPPEHPRDTSHAFSARCLRLPIRPVWWHDYRRDDFPTLEFVVVIANPLAICCMREEPFALSAAPTIWAGTTTRGTSSGLVLKPTPHVNGLSSDVVEIFPFGHPVLPSTPEVSIPRCASTPRRHTVEARCD